MSVHANYFDGKTSAGIDVILDFDDTDMVIRLPDGKEKRWAFNDISISQELVPPLDGVLVCHSCDSNSRLVISSLKDWRVVTKNFRRYRFIPAFMRQGWSSVFICGGITMVVIAAFVMLMPTIVERSVVLLPQSYMEKLEEESKQFFARWPECNSPKGVQAMESLIGPLIKAADLPSYSLRVLKDDRIANALVFSGGNIVVFQGLIDEIDHVDELSGVLAHEIAHAKLQHIEKSIVRDTGLSVLLLLMLGGTDLSYGAIHAGDFLHRMKYSRKDELEADAVGYQLLVDAGMPPGGIHAFFEKNSHHEAEKSTKDVVLGLLRTHPYSEERAQALEVISAQDTKVSTKNPLSDDEWAAIKNICTPVASGH